MAIALQPRFPIPKPRKNVSFKNDEDGVIDIGWCDGVLSDGRPFRAETWAQDGVTMLTIYFSNAGIEELDNDALCKFIQAEDLVAFVDDDPKHINARKWTNDEGNEFWSVNI